MSKPSKYNDFACELVAGLHADAAIVFVVGGVSGSGFARAERPQQTPDQQEQIRIAQVKTLRAIADDIEKGITQPDQLKHRRGSA